MAQLPSTHVIDYEMLIKQAPACGGLAGVTEYLRQQLPGLWRQVYGGNCRHVPRFIQYMTATALYLFDRYSALESDGEVAFDQSVHDRVVAALGLSQPEPLRPRRGRRSLWGPPPEELVGSGRDQGHFLAHAIGGGLEVNLFSQNRALNRGQSAQGKLYRQMERHCRLHPGTLCFARPIYDDGSAVPRWLEFGLLRPDASLWVEVFDN